MMQEIQRINYLKETNKQFNDYLQRYQEKPKSTPEFVPFTEDELTIENIKRCCERHFAAQVGTSLVCDILAGEEGPTCKTLEQIADMKVIYVRFVTGKHPRLCTRMED